MRLTSLLKGLGFSAHRPIPPEIVARVAGYLDLPDLFALARVDKATHQLLHPLLYQRDAELANQEQLASAKSNWWVLAQDDTDLSPVELFAELAGPCRSHDGSGAGDGASTHSDSDNTKSPAAHRPATHGPPALYWGIIHRQLATVRVALHAAEAFAYDSNPLSGVGIVLRSADDGSPFSVSPVQLAVLAGDAGILAALLGNLRCDLDLVRCNLAMQFRSDEGRLHRACVEGCKEVIELGGQGGSYEQWCCSALHMAVRAGRGDMVRMLLDAGASVRVGTPWVEEYARRVGEGSVRELAARLEEVGEARRRRMSGSGGDVAEEVVVRVSGRRILSL